MKSYSYLDSHTGGEPTRLILDGGPDLGGGSMAERLAVLRRDHDALRRAVINEPRGSDVLVGALLCPPVNPTCAAGVIFFNNVGYLGMCGHGSIGLAASLAYLGRIRPGLHKIETPVGVVEATLHAGAGPYPNRVTLRNVRSYRHAQSARVHVPGIGVVHGDIAWGGNWFFLMHEHGQQVAMAHLGALTDYAARVREALSAQGVTGAGGAEIDHIELFAPTPTADGKSFVLCPGRAYDRSPCGTGTSAKLACLAADGLLAPGQVWRQESVVGSIFEGSVEPAVDGAGVIPSITGEAWVMGAGQLLADPRDPFALGIV